MLGLLLSVVEGRYLKKGGGGGGGNPPGGDGGSYEVCEGYGDPIRLWTMREASFDQYYCALFYWPYHCSFVSSSSPLSLALETTGRTEQYALQHGILRQSVPSR